MMLNPLMRFAQMMQELREFAQEHDAKPSQIVAEVLERSGLLEELKKSQDPQDQSRVENLSQLQSVAAEYEQNTPDATLAGFLETTALVADSDQLPDESQDSGKVTLMTLPGSLRRRRLWPTPTSCPMNRRIPAR